MLIALTGQVASQVPQVMHSSLITLGITILLLIIFCHIKYGIIIVSYKNEFVNGF